MSQEIRLLLTSLNYIYEVTEGDYVLLEHIAETSGVDIKEVRQMLKDIHDAEKYRCTIIKIKDDE